MALELLVAALSRHGEGRSLIGFAPDGQSLVRLVAPTPSGVLYPKHHRLPSGDEVRPFDLIRVSAPWADSRPAQPENRIVDDTPWQLLERPAARSHCEALERSPLAPGSLFGGQGRAVRDQRGSPGPSIVYITAQNILAVCEWRGYSEAFRTRLRFLAGGVSYDLPLTDLYYHRRLLQRGEGIYTLDQLGCRAPHGLRLLVSLGDAFHGWRYKIVCGIVPRRTYTLFRDHESPPTSPQRFDFRRRPLDRPGAYMGGA